MTRYQDHTSLLLRLRPSIIRAMRPLIATRLANPDRKDATIMSIMRRTVWGLTLLAFVIMTSGCSKHYVRTVDEELERDGSGLREESGLEIAGYVLSDGIEESYAGRVRLAGQDSLAFWVERDAENFFGEASGDLLKVEGPVLARSEVEAFKFEETKAGATVALIFGSFVLLFAIAFVISFSTGDWNFE